MTFYKGEKHRESGQSLQVYPVRRAIHQLDKFEQHQLNHNRQPPGIFKCIECIFSHVFATGVANHRRFAHRLSQNAGLERGA